MNPKRIDIPLSKQPEFSHKRQLYFTNNTAYDCFSVVGGDFIFDFLFRLFPIISNIESKNKHIASANIIFNTIQITLTPLPAKEKMGFVIDAEITAEINGIIK